MEKPDSISEPLTKRELEILSCLSLKLSNQEIAADLSLSINSVKWYARQIYTKLGVENRRQAILKARELGLLVTSFRAAAGDKRFPSLPSGTITFLFTEIEDSAVLWGKMPGEMQASQAAYQAILLQAIEANGGQVIQIAGDAFQAAFQFASKGLYAAISAQRALQSTPWGATGPIRVRMGLHTGPADPDPSGRLAYQQGQTVNRAAQIMSAGHGGQILVSREAANLVDRALPEGVEFKDLGEHSLKGSDRPEHLFQILAAGLPQAFPPLPTAILHANNLPVQVTSFVGRDAEIREVNQFLEANRLVTLYGSGGIGKTRLALEVAASQLDRFSAGAWLVELAPLSDPETVPQTIAAALGLQRITEISYQALLVNYLREKQLLLVLDNCEHVLEVCARLADHLLHKCPRLTLLVTSRETLRISGEVAYRVPSLSAPDPAGRSRTEVAQAEAVRLFAERAAAVLPGFRLTDQILPSVARLCRRLDGIPLAIELAAARVNVLAVDQIAARLDDAFRLLSDGSRTAVARQRTLRGSIDWSYSLLTEPERLVLQRLSVFSGGWTLEAAEQVCAFDGLEKGEILDGLASLVHKSLVMADPISSGLARYRMLETIRQFAQEKLLDGGQGDKTHDLHLDYFMVLAEEYGPLLRTPQIVSLLDQLDLEIDNLRGAINWAVVQGSQEGLEKVIRILHPLQYFWFTRALVIEVVNWVDGVLSHLSGSTLQAFDLRAKALFLEGFLHTVYSLDIEKAAQNLRASVQLFRVVNNHLGEGLASGLLHMALSQITSPAYYERFKDIRNTAEEEAEQIRADCLTIANTLITQPDPESRWTAANILWWLDFYPPFADRQNNQERRNFLHQARSIFTELGDRLGEVNILTGLDYIGLSSPGENEPPYPYLTLDQGLELARRLKSKFSLVWLTTQSGLAVYFQGDYQKMVDYFQSVRRLFQDTGQLWGESWSIRMVGVGYYYLEDIPQALISFRESMDSYSNRLRDTSGIYQNLIFLAGISVEIGVHPLAVKLLGFIERYYENNHRAIEQMEKIEFARTVNKTKMLFNADQYVSLWQQGRAMTFKQALADARRIEDAAKRLITET